MSRQIKNFIIDSDYPIEKVAGVFEGAGTTNAGETIFTLSNPLNVALLIDGVFSEDNWASSYPISAGDKNRNVGMLEVLACTESQIQWRFFSNAGINVKYRLWGFLPEDYPADVPKTDSVSSYPFTIDTSKNYMKVFKSGRATVTSGNSVTIPHDLGYIPFVKVWGGANNAWALVNQGIQVNIDYPVTVTATDLILNDIQETQSYYYRIYVNEA